MFKSRQGPPRSSPRDPPTAREGEGKCVETNAGHSDARRDWFAALWFLAPLLWLFRRALFLGEVFAFRDAAHYYFPFYQYVQNRWKAGLPLWNPLDGIGQPLLGDPTAAVVYPGKLLFLLPVPYAMCFTLYVVGHLWLGGCGAYRLSRSYRASYRGAIVAGLAYELSGQVLFQYCNTIYSVGAGWLPWAILYLTRSPRRTSRRDTGLLCFSLSMLVLGGDPQSAYHVLLVGLVCAVVRFRDRGPNALGWARLAKDIGLLCFAGVATLLLCAVQVFPTYEWARLSDRALRDGPRSAYEWVGDGAAALLAGSEFPSARSLWCRTPGEGHAKTIYQFSVGPWRWFELLWPNVSGRPFPTHRRWLSGFPGEGRMWTPSLYLGLLPLLLAAFRFRLTRAARRTLWWSWTVLLSAVAAIGVYGLGWIVDELRYQLEPTSFANTELLPGLGGVYWLMTVALPGYVGFRYPAKLWTFATLGLAVLAAKGWPAVTVHQRWLTNRGVWLAAVSLGFAVLAFTPLTSSWLAQVPPNPLFGPLDVAKARGELVVSLLHAVTVAACMILILKWASGTTRSWALLVVMAVELTMAQASLVQTVPPAQPPGMLSVAEGDILYRCEPARAYPERWERTSSDSRFQEIQRNDLETLMPKNHLTAGARSVQSTGPMTCADYFVLAELGKETGRVDPGGHRIPNRAWLNLVGAEHVFAPSDDFLSLQPASDQPGDPTMQHGLNPDALPRAWLVHRWQSLDELARRDRNSLMRRTREVMFHGSAQRDFRKIAMIESSTELPASPASVSGAGDDCRIVEQDAQRMLLSVKTDAPAMVVLADQYYPGWRAQLTSAAGVRTPTRIFRVNRVMRGVYVEAGNYQLEFNYRPIGVSFGIGTSLLAWTMLTLAMISSGRSPLVKSES